MDHKANRYRLVDSAPMYLSLELRFPCDFNKVDTNTICNDQSGQIPNVFWGHQKLQALHCAHLRLLLQKRFKLYSEKKYAQHGINKLLFLSIVDQTYQAIMSSSDMINNCVYSNSNPTKKALSNNWSVLTLINITLWRLRTYLLLLTAGWERDIWVHPPITSTDCKTHQHHNAHHGFKRESPSVDSRTQSFPHVREVLHRSARENQSNIRTESKKRIESFCLVDSSYLQKEHSR